MSQLIERGERPSLRLQSLVRLAMAHVQWASHDVAMFVYASAGTTGLRAGTIQRLFRDMHAGTQHLIASPPVFRALGRERSEERRVGKECTTRARQSTFTSHTAA